MTLPGDGLGAAVVDVVDCDVVGRDVVGRVVVGFTVVGFTVVVGFWVVVDCTVVGLWVVVDFTVVGFWLVVGFWVGPVEDAVDCVVGFAVDRTVVGRAVVVAPEPAVVSLLPDRPWVPSVEPSVMPPSVLEAPDVDVEALVCDEEDVEPFTSPSVVSGTDELSVRSLLYDSSGTPSTRSGSKLATSAGSAACSGAPATTRSAPPACTEDCSGSSVPNVTTAKVTKRVATTTITARARKVDRLLKR